MQKKISAKRLSKLQRTLLIVLSKNRGRQSYSDLHRCAMERLRVSWKKKYAFKVSFSRSMSNLVAKKWVSREIHGWRISRITLRWDTIKITRTGLIILTTYQ